LLPNPGVFDFVNVKKVTVLFVTFVTIVTNMNLLLFSQLNLFEYLHKWKLTNMVTPELTQEITRLHADICSALADSRRILILYALAERSLNVSEVAEEVGISQPAASRHLTILRERAMVSAQREGQAVIYRLADMRTIQALDLLRSILADNLKSRGELASSFLETK
jgi:ArsR family transcriptional regulator